VPYGKSRSEIGSQQKLTGPSGHEENGTVNGEPEKGGHGGTTLCNIKPLEETLEGDIKSGKIPRDLNADLSVNISIRIKKESII